MLTDTALKNLKPNDSLYKISDRDGMYVTVAPLQLAASGERVLLVETSGLPEFARTRAFYAGLGYDEEARIREFYAASEDKVVFRKALQR